MAKRHHKVGHPCWFRTQEPVKKEGGRSPEGERRFLCSEAFISLLQAGTLGWVSGQGFSRRVISAPGVPFQGHGLHWLVSGRARGSLVTAAGAGIAHLVLVLFWAWSWNTTEARCHLWGDDLLYLAVNCSASVFSCLSQFLCSTCQKMSLSPYHLNLCVHLFVCDEQYYVSRCYDGQTNESTEREKNKMDRTLIWTLLGLLMSQSKNVNWIMS